MNFLLPALGSLLGGGASYLSQKAALDKKKKALSDYRAELDKSKYSPDDLAASVSALKAIGNSQTMSALNSIAGQTAGTLNETQAKGAMIAPLLSSQTQTIFQARQKYDDYNRQIDLKKAAAGLEAGNESTDAGDIFGSAMGGAEAGMALDKLLNPTDPFGNPIKKPEDVDSNVLADSLAKDIPPMNSQLSTPDLGSDAGSFDFSTGLFDVNSRKELKQNVKIKGFEPQWMQNLFANSDFRRY